MNRYTIYCTEDQTRKALEFGAPIEFIKIGKRKPLHYICSRENKVYYKIPTAEQMRGWLKGQGFKFILSDIKDFDEKCWVVIHNDKEVSYGTNIEDKELDAIDAALEYLEKTAKE